MSSKFGRTTFRLKEPCQCRPKPPHFSACDPPLPLPQLHCFASWKDLLCVEPFDHAETFALQRDPTDGTYFGRSAPTAKRLEVRVSPTAVTHLFNFYIAVYGNVGIIHDHAWYNVGCKTGLWFLSPYLSALDPHAEAPVRMQVMT